MSGTSLPLRLWAPTAILSVAADDAERARKAISRRTSDAAAWLGRQGIDASSVAERVGAEPAAVERLLAEPVPPPAVMLDTEDAVAPGRDRAVAALAAAAERLGDAGWSTGTLRLVRLPAADAGAATMLLDRAACPPDAIVLPKAEDPGTVARVKDVVAARGDVRLILLLETPRGVEAAAGLTAAAGDRLAGIVFGAVDYAASSGVRSTDEDHPLVSWARLAVVNAAAAAEVPAVDGMTLAFPVAPRGAAMDEARTAVLDGLATTHARAEAAAALGMSGKLVGHPGQLLAVLLAFDEAFPDGAVGRWEDEVRAYARLVAGGAGVGVDDGAMVDAATDRRNRSLLRRAAGIGRWSPARAVELNVITPDEADRLAQQRSPR